LDIIVPEGSLLNPHFPAAVVAGNVETSQAVTNAIFAALGVLGSSQGTMNNLTFGNERYQYYETICSGSPAGMDSKGKGFHGVAAVHTHMTNTRMTDPEILEQRYPVILKEFRIDRDSGGKGKYNAGDGITRTITLTAIGVVEEQLPQITSIYPNSVKTYPDQAETTTVEKDDTLIAQRKESIAIIPSQAGQLVIPEVRIPWFNTLTQQTEFAVLAEKILQILPATIQPSSAIPLSPSIQADPVTKPQTSITTGLNNQSINMPQYWIWLTASLLVLWLLTLVFWYKHVVAIKAATKHAGNSLARNTLNEQSLWKSLEKALNKDAPLETQNYLALWLGNCIQDKQAPLAQSLKTIENQALNEAVNSLLASRYSKNQSEWQGAKLHQILRKLRKDGSIEKHSKRNLSPLYPVS